MSTRISKTKKSKTNERSEPRKQPIQNRSKATVEDILTAAAQVFNEYGYAAGTTNRIAKRAGVSIGTIYQYFPNKEAIAVALLEQHINQMIQQLNEWVAQVVAKPRSLRESLYFFVDKIIETHAESPGLLGIFIEETPLTPGIRELLLSVEKEAAKMLTGLMGLYPGVQRIHLARAALVVQTVILLTHRHVAFEDQLLTRTAFRKELVYMLEAYLTTDSCEI